ncbi:MAG: carboxylesterase family protein, partial [Parasporobacterium sp.]|nr:carboxylesterase family protein [Parasporobacterium sp.]
QTPAADGLYHRAVLLSGGMGGFHMKSNPAPSDLLPKEIMKEAGVSTVKELEEVPKSLFIHAVNVAGRRLEAEGYTFFWGPKANGWYLGDPLEAGVSPYYKTIPTLGGTVYSDLVFGGRFDKDFDAYSDEEAKTFIEERYGAERSAGIIDAFRKAYPSKRLIDLLSLDVNIRKGAREYLMFKAKESSAPVWNMLTTLTFDYFGGTPAWHCADLPFIFGISENLALYNGMGEVTEKLKTEISAAVCAFARSGDPNNSDTPAWQPVTGESFRTMVFDEISECKEDFDCRLGELIQAAGKDPGFFLWSAFGDPKGESDNDWMF